MHPIVKYLRNNTGYGRMKDLKDLGFQTRDIRKLVQQGMLVKLKAGLYRVADLRPSETTGLIEICLAIPKAVICLTSALAFHELTTTIPTAIDFAIPLSGKAVKIPYPPNEVHFFSPKQYGEGIEHHETRWGDFRIYGPEKTICDLFRFRNKLGEDIALEGLKEYLKRSNRDLDALMKFARICRVERVISQYVKAIIG